jgi:S-methylmethionine-dependent homocysteine/selenocysteine methylase
VLESPTWRASSDWGQLLGYGRGALEEANRRAIELLRPIKRRLAEEGLPAVISGCVGPRGDGYVPSSAMSVEEAQDFHMAQIAVFAASAADMVAAITMNYAEEASGVALGAKAAGMPAVISFTVETDGRLPTGQPLGEAIAQVDAHSGGYPSYYMLNCAHPDHFDLVLRKPWTERIRGLRANASRKSHAELNESTTLDAGDPAELAALYADLKAGSLGNLNVVGGCCGTDERHVESIAAKMGSGQFT